MSGVCGFFPAELMSYITLKPACVYGVVS